MEEQKKSQEQILKERIEELTTSLGESTRREEEFKAKALENEKIIGEVRAENESLKNEVKVQKESTEMYRGWWTAESEKYNSLIEKMKSIAILTDCIVSSVKK